MWFQDEARVGQHGTLTRLWAARGSRPRIRRDRRFTWTYLFGAICPARGTGAAVVMPYVGVEAMNHHLIEISATVSPGAVALLIIDGAGWHRSNQLVVPDNIVLLKLPPYAPELNPTENIWQYLRAKRLGELGLGNLRSYCRGLLQRLERPHRQAGGHHLNRHPTMGASQYLGQLILVNDAQAAKTADEADKRARLSLLTTQLQNVQLRGTVVVSPPSTQAITPAPAQPVSMDQDDLSDAVGGKPK